mmetsp:Transcript_62642/g.123838  ORF Transcript_62642/g.123838 Transcript_62642/m.123838 type:complete len:113 (-) Transcript_62642:48-386(-)
METKPADPEKGGGAGKTEEKELGTCQAICFAIMDFLAMIFRGIVACFRAIFHCIRARWYHVKEVFYDLWDAWDACLHPYVTKRPVFGVDRFLVYDSVKSQSVREGKAKKERF